MGTIVAGSPKQGSLVSYHGGHTLYDGTGRLEDFVEAAIRQGFKGLGLSEHMPAPPRYPYPDQPSWDEAVQKFDRYVSTVQELKVTYRDELPLLLGVEVEYLPDEEEYLTDFLARYPFDYVVGSVHYVAGIGFDHCREWYDEAAQKCGGYQNLAVSYYRNVRGLLALGVTDVLGHLDLINIFSPAPISGDDVAEAEEATLAAALHWNVVLDVNGRGLIKPCKQIYPREELLRKAREMGIPATFGDDSHAPDQVGARLDEVRATMRVAGYQTVTAFLLDGHQIRRVELPL